MQSKHEYSTTCTYLGVDFDPRTWNYNASPTPYCGCKSRAFSNYCESHHSIVYQTGTALRKRHKDIRVKTSLEDLCQMIIDINEELELEGWEPEQGWEEEAVA